MDAIIRPLGTRRSKITGSVVSKADRVPPSVLALRCWGRSPRSVVSKADRVPPSVDALRPEAFSFALAREDELDLRRGCGL
jgi:hypothetical protein